MIDEYPRLAAAPSWMDHYHNIDYTRMRRERAERARAVMRAANVPALLVTGSDNVRYLTGFWQWDLLLNTSYCLFFVDHEPIVFGFAGTYQQMPDYAPWIKHWGLARSWYGGAAGVVETQEETAKYAAEIREKLDERGLAGEPLAVVETDSYGQNALREAGLNIVDGVPIMLEASKIKTPDEIKCLQMATVLCGVGFQAGTEAMKPGTHTAKVAKAMADAAGAAGAMPSRGKATAGPLAFPRGQSGIERIVEHGDIGYIWMCGTSFLGYTACLYRTIKVGGPPTAKEADWFKQLKERMDAVIDALQPGASTADAAKHFPPASKWGYTDEAEVNTVEFAHGIGLVNIGSWHVHYNLPTINRQWSLRHEQEIVPGMVVAVESLEGEHGVGGVRMENMVVVTENGPQLLDVFPREEILQGGG